MLLIDVIKKIHLKDFISDASFWLPDSLVESAWIEHAPFAFWLIEAHRPRILVELGTHNGYSYLVFNQAVKGLDTGTRCLAVDTWKGDEHSGLYGPEVLERLREYHDRRYASFSQLVPLTFDEAVESFQDGTIDLLHIDGRHFYEDVRHDFETWKPKLSNRAVVMFHDICVRENGFGVFRLWEELRAKYPYFEFIHGHGLGILGVGKALSDAVSALLAASKDPATADQIRAVYNRLGSALTDQFMYKYWKADAERLFSKLAQETAEHQRAEGELAQQTAERQRVEGELAQQTTERQRVEGELAQETAERDRLEVELAQRTAERQRLEEELAQETAGRQRLEAELAQETAGRQRLEAELAQRTDERKRLETESRHRIAECERVNAALAKKAAEREQTRTELAQLRAERERLQSELTVRTAQIDGILSSTSWRLTTAVRAIGKRMPWLKKQLGLLTKGRQ